MSYLTASHDIFQIFGYLYTALVLQIDALVLSLHWESVRFSDKATDSLASAPAPKYASDRATSSNPRGPYRVCCISCNYVRPVYAPARAYYSYTVLSVVILVLRCRYPRLTLMHAAQQ